jgi:dihydrofolate reductase
MSVIAGITTSVDGYVAGPGDGQAAGRDVSISGGADVIRQTLAAGYVDELAISTAPLVLGGGKRLFDGFEHDIELEVRRVYTSPYATHVRYTVKR